MSEHADRLVGFVHSAGILRDALLMNQDAEKYDAVFKPKAWAAPYISTTPSRSLTATSWSFCGLRQRPRRDLWQPGSVAVRRPGLPIVEPRVGFNCDALPLVVFGLPCTAMQWPVSVCCVVLDSLSRYRNAKGLPFHVDAVSPPVFAAAAAMASRRPRRDGRRRNAIAATLPTHAGWGEVGMAAGLEGFARKRMEESPMPFFTNAQGLAGMDVGLSTGVSPFCVMRYNASAFFDQSNAEAKNASAHYMRKFWGQSIPPKELTELDVYDAVKSNFYEPHELTFAHFISGSGARRAQFCWCLALCPHPPRFVGRAC